MKQIIYTLLILGGLSAQASYIKMIEQDLIEVQAYHGCESGWMGKASDWRNWYCVENQDPKQQVYEAFFRSCFKYEGTGGGNGLVTIYRAIDAVWRIGGPVCLPEVCDKDPSAECLIR